jgi:2-alkenal reductase
MPPRLARIVTIWLLLLLTIWIAEPVLLPLLYGASQPRPVEPRGDLSAAEKSTIALFRNAAPSVLHIFAEPVSPSKPGRVQTGSGLIWDRAGDQRSSGGTLQLVGLDDASGGVLAPAGQPSHGG